MMRKNILVFIGLVLISLVLVLIWLPGKGTIGGGDIGNPLLEPGKALDVQSLSWWETHGTGIVSPTTYTALPFYIFFGGLDYLNIPNWLNQKLLFLLVLSIGSSSVYLLARTFKYNFSTSVLSALLYIFNLVSLSVWHRGIHNAIMMILFMPLTLLILVKGVEKKSFKSLIWICVASFLGSYIFGALGYLFSLWLMWIVYLANYLITNWHDKERRRFILIYSLLLFIFWFLTNAWWLLHFLVSSKYVLGQYNIQELRSRGSDVLVSLQPYLEPRYVLRGIARYYHYVVLDWGASYLNPGMIFLSWILPIFAYGTVFHRENFNKLHWRYLFLLSILVIFISKGSNMPLDWFNRFFYDQIPSLAPLRNPYEKVGILLALIYPLLFSLGFNQLYFFLKSTKYVAIRSIILVALFLCVTILVWPLWVGNLFISEGRNYLVNFPNYYTDTSDWLSKRYDDTRILHLPIAFGESTEYAWGYTGIEPSQYIFQGSSIGYFLDIESTDRRFRDLSILIHKHDSGNFVKSLASLNVGWIVVHNETFVQRRGLEPLESIQALLESSSDYLEHQVDFGPLSIWRVKDEYKINHIYASSNLVEVDRSTTHLFSKDFWQAQESLTDSYASSQQLKKTDILQKMVIQRIIDPIRVAAYPDIKNLNLQNALDELTHVSHLPGSTLYPLIRFKEKIVDLFNKEDPLVRCIEMSNKRLVEASKLFLAGDHNRVNQSLSEYEEQLNRCRTLMALDDFYLLPEDLRQLVEYKILRSKLVLESYFTESSSQDIKDRALTSLNNLALQMGVLNKYLAKDYPTDKDIYVYIYDVLQEGDYLLKLVKPTTRLTTLNPEIIQVDDMKVGMLPISNDTSSIEFSALHLLPGRHEIFVSRLKYQPTRLSLSDPLFNQNIPKIIDKETGRESFELSDKNGTSVLSYSLPVIDNERMYNFTFDYKVISGLHPIFYMVNNHDSIDSRGNPATTNFEAIHPKFYTLDWNRHTVVLKPSLSTTASNVYISAMPISKCGGLFTQSFCKEMKSKSPSSSTVIRINNIEVEENMRDRFSLFSNNQSSDNKSASLIKTRKISPINFEIDTNNQQPPYILVFSETYHPLWQIKDPNSGQIINLKHIVVNDYANGWLIDKPIPENVKLEFTLQSKLVEGVLISTASLLALILLTALLDKKRIYKPNE